MSSTQKCSRCSRQASRNICRHSAPGRTDTLTRSRSTQPLRTARRRRRRRSAASRRPEHAQPVARLVEQRLAVAAEPEVGDAVDQRSVFWRLEVVDVEHALGRRRRSYQSSSSAALDRAAGEQRLALDARRSRSYRPSGTGNATTRSLDARPGRSRPASAGRPRPPSLGLRPSSCVAASALRAACGARDERRAARRARSAIGVRPGAEREAQVELQLVVHRVEVALADEIQVLAVRGRRPGACRAGPGRVARARLAGLDPAQLDRRGLRACRAARRPASARPATRRGPRSGRARCGRVDARSAARRRGRPAAARCGGWRAPPGRRAATTSSSTTRPMSRSSQPARRGAAVGGEDDQQLLARRRRWRPRPGARAVVQPASAGGSARRPARRAGGPGPPSAANENALPRVVTARPLPSGLSVALSRYSAGGHEAAVALGARAAAAGRRSARRLVGGGIEQVEVARRAW